MKLLYKLFILLKQIFVEHNVVYRPICSAFTKESFSTLIL